MELIKLRNVMVGAWLIVGAGCSRDTTPPAPASAPALDLSLPLTDESKVLAVRAVARTPDTVFHGLSFDDARLRAAVEHKLVFVDFFTETCAPCKRMDAGTWRDADVIKYLGGVAVAIKIDAEKEPRLAAHYRVASYPTLLFIRPDGTEYARFKGYHSSADFLKKARPALADFDPLAEVRAQAEQPRAELNPSTRQMIGEELVHDGQYAAALHHFLWCFDHGLEHDPEYVGLRNTALIFRLAGLAQVYPPAREALLERRDRAAARLRAGEHDYTAAMDVTAINHELGDDAPTLALFDELAAHDPPPQQVLGVLFTEIRDQLLAQQRYADVLQMLGDVDAFVAARFADYEEILQTSQTNPDAVSPGSERVYVIEVLGEVYEALVGARQDGAAQRLARRLGVFAPEPTTYLALMRRAAAAGRPDAARTLAALARAALGPEACAEVEALAAGLPETPGATTQPAP